MMRRVQLSAAEARRVALAATGFDQPRPKSSPNRRHFRRVIETLGLLQLDFVNVLLPAQYLVVWSRLGPYDRNRFKKFVYGSGAFTEQWAHEASVVPVSAWPLLAHRRARWKPHKNNPVLRIRNRKAYLARVLDQVRDEGALTASELPAVPGPKRKPGDWHRSVPRWALEYHFARGELTVSDRMPNFQRVYDLPQRVIPEPHLSMAVDVEESSRELLRRAAAALGIATLRDLSDYFRMTPAAAAPRVAELVESGDLRPIRVEDWQDEAYLSSNACLPREIAGASLLSPFDPVTWFRPRAERLFGFHYRIEIYVPAGKRRWGYYVLPFRMGEDIVARVDLKADRQAGKLLIQAAYGEEGVDIEQVTSALAAELIELGNWLGLEKLKVRRHNSFARELGKRICLQSR
jgi:uncharacterized protein YcaQ